MQTRRRVFSRLPHFVRCTHEKVRTLTCLAQKLSLASRLEHSNSDEQQSTVAERPLLPLAGFSKTSLADQKTWKLELAPFRCSVPHSPSWWRVSQVRLRGCCAAAYVPDACFPARTCGGTAVSSVSQAVEACSTLTVTGRTCAASGPRFTRNLLTIAICPVSVKQFARKTGQIAPRC